MQDPKAKRLSCPSSRADGFVPLSFLQKQQIFAWFLGVGGGGGRTGAFIPPPKGKGIFILPLPQELWGWDIFSALAPVALYDKRVGEESSGFYLFSMISNDFLHTWVTKAYYLWSPVLPSSFAKSLLEAHRKELASESSPCVCGSQFLYTGRYIRHRRSLGVCYDFTLFLLTWVYGSLFSLPC